MLAGLSCACGAQEPAASGGAVFFPRHEISGGPTALISGTIRHEGSCVWIESGPFRYLVIWPPGSGIARSESGALEVIGPGLVARLHDGDQATLGGGESTDEAQIRQLIGADIPAPCRSPRYWIASTVQGT